MAKVPNMIYNLIFKRTSTFALTILGTAFMFERGFDMASDYIFHTINKGKLWKDIQHKYQ